MFLKIILNFFIGLLVGFVFEFIYRSVKAKRATFPRFVNYQMYGVTAAFLVFIYYLNVSLIFKLILMFLFPTLVESIIGYLYIKINGVYPWDYSKEPLNMGGIICLRFSLICFAIVIFYYYSVLPLLVN